MSSEQDRARPQTIEWIALLVGLALTLRYRWLIDDAFVYFRYLDNLLWLDIGLVYNQGEYVEGFSSPAWLLLLLPLRALRLDYWFTVQAVGCLAFIVFWYLLVQLNRQMSPAGRVVNLPLLFLAPNYAVASYFTSGLETPLVQLIAPAYALSILNPGSRWLEILIAVSPLVRPELSVPLVLVAAWSWYRAGRPPWRLLTLSSVAVGGWLLFRIYYYADLFPNTFYLKHMAIPRQGWVYLHETLATYQVYLTAGLVALAFAYLVYRRGWRRESRLAARAMMLLVAGTVTAYVVAIGGDPRHYRFLAFSVCLGACSLAGVPERLLQPLLRRGPWVPVPLGTALLALYFASYPPQLDRHPVTLKERQRRVDQISDASFHRHMPRLQASRWRAETSPERMLAYRQEHPSFQYRDVGVGFWCVLLYQRFDTRIVHSLGLTDAFLARTEMPADRPAHKWGLAELARDIAAVRRLSGYVDRGMFRWAVEQGNAAGWIVANLETIEIIERKVFNRHRLGENLRLALIFPPKIDPD